ncbi:MAG: bifunctional 4'-phosphopantothenoylcysteine decarboxylase/phosphopantothenoylcysteine synthetase, partial [Planctomycetes bacterium]|nr:bifunctional 4'-phosphopantothenoylcysteine decarboxylase/phosphopantothenoylcysteine synthetase [Planctomycetota bacterium]
MSRILLAAGASAALHKACDLASTLAQDGHSVRVLLTPRAAELVRPQLFEALTGQPACVSEFGDARRAGMDHIELARWAEVFLVAPATAGLVASLALGLADDLVSTVALALPPGVKHLLCPAMNPHMLAAPPVARNLAQLARDGWQVVEPEAGR